DVERYPAREAFAALDLARQPNLLARLYGYFVLLGARDQVARFNELGYAASHFTDNIMTVNQRSGHEFERRGFRRHRGGSISPKREGSAVFLGRDGRRW